MAGAMIIPETALPTVPKTGRPLATDCWLSVAAILIRARSVEVQVYPDPPFRSGAGDSFAQRMLMGWSG